MARKIKQRFPEPEKVEPLAPLPLRRETSPAEPFPVEALGKLLGDAARAIMDKVQCPDAIACQSVLAAAALAVQAHADVIHPALKYRSVLSLYFVTVAKTGERKTAADRFALEPIRLREADLYELHVREHQNYLDARAAYDKGRELALKSKDANERKANLAALGPPPAAPLIPVLIVNEPTLEGLHKLMAEGEPSMGLFSDEGGSFIGGHGMSDDARLRTAAGLSDYWDGKTIKRVRGGDGTSVLRGRRLSLHLMVQPGISDGLLADRTLFEQGLSTRLLVAAPQSLAGTRMQRKLKSTTEPALKRYIATMTKLLKQPQPRTSARNAELKPREIKLTADAERAWSAFADECELNLADGQRLEPVRGFANKLSENALRIAAVLELVENLDASHVILSTMERAIKISRYYAGEALRLFEQGSFSPELQRAEKLLKWLRENWGRPIVALPHIYQSGPNSIRDAGRAREAVSILERHHWLRQIPGGATIDGKRYREAWEIAI